MQVIGIALAAPCRPLQVTTCII